MKTVIAMLLLMTPVLLPGPTLAASPPPAASGAAVPTALLEAKRCVVCHDEQLTRIAPPFVKIARRYRNIDSAREQLIRRIQQGTDGPSPVYHFGDETMPRENVRVPVSDAEAGVLADYILSLGRR